jgi:hypothetical protein
MKMMNGKIMILKSVEAEKDRDEPVIATNFMATVGKIIDELQLMQGIDTYLVVKQIALDGEPKFGNLTQLEEDQETATDLINITMTLQVGH